MTNSSTASTTITTTITIIFTTTSTVLLVSNKGVCDRQTEPVASGSAGRGGAHLLGDGSAAESCLMR